MREENQTVDTLEDGSLKLSLEIDGFTSSLYVTSSHLITEGKWQQLRESCFNQALRAYEQPC